MNRIYLDQASISFPKAPGVATSYDGYLTMNGVNVNRGLLLQCLLSRRSYL